MLPDTASLASRIEQIASNPMDNGATGDGVANDHTAVQAAITNAVGVVDLLGKTYRCDSSLLLTSGLTIRNGGLDFSSIASNTYLSATGSIGASVALTVNAVAGGTTITVADASCFAAGDVLSIVSAATYSTAARG